MNDRTPWIPRLDTVAASQLYETSMARFGGRRIYPLSVVLETIVADKDPGSWCLGDNTHRGN